MASTHLPSAPFDGQKFIDSRSIEWTYDASTKSWRSGAAVRDVPNASETTQGLLTPQMKALLDRLPKRGGGFGILSKPLLSIVPLRRDVAYRGVVRSARQNESGSEVVVESAVFTDNQFIGKAVFFVSGILKARAYMLYSNGGETLYLAGTDASQAKRGDKFEIIDPLYLNQDGAIVGDIRLVSYSLDVSCIDADGNTIDGACPAEGAGSDENLAGLDIKVSEEFLNEFCVSIPGQPGPQGDDGPKGEPGADGTGDGPRGLPGDPGVDAPPIPSVINGVRVQDINDIYDSAVVGVELDAAAGKLYVVKGRVRTPSQNRPAQQIMASAISRDVRFTDSQYAYDILMPSGDPIGSEDVSVLHYPKHAFTTLTPGAPIRDTEVIVTKLSKIIEAMVAHVQARIQQASDQWDQEIKPFIESKDEEARKELYDLSDSVARCEWGLGMEFCLGVIPDKCGLPDPDAPEEQPQQFSTPEILGSDWEGAVSTPMPVIDVPPLPPPPPPPPPTIVPVPGSGTPTTSGYPTYVPTTSSQPTIDGTIDVNDREARRELDSGDEAGTYEDGSASESNGLDPSSANTSSLSASTNVGSAFKPLTLGGSTELPPGAVVVSYAGGSGRSNETAHAASVVLKYKDNDGNEGEVTLQEPDSAVMNNWDQPTFEQSMENDSESVVIHLSGGGKIYAKFELPGTGQTGSVQLNAVHVTHPDNLGRAPIPVQMTMQRDSAGNIVDAASGVDCGDCPECPECYDIIASSISPATIDMEAGQTVTILGSGFGSSTPTVLIGSTPATVISSTDTQIIISTPPLAENTDYNVTIINNDNGAEEVFPNALRVDTPPPSFSGLSPASGSAAGGTTVTIDGANFGSAPVVTINGVPQTIVSNDDNQIIITTTANPVGTYDVTVLNGTTGESGTAVNGYTYT
jgi:hypothetical protein